MAGGRGIYHLLRHRLHSHYTAHLALSSLILKKDQDGARSAGVKSSRALALLGAGVTGLFGFTTNSAADEAEHGVECPSYPWPHQGILSSYDHASIRRSHQVYTQVCASCHSMGLISYRELVGVAYTEEETRQWLPKLRWSMVPMTRVRCLHALASSVLDFLNLMQTNKLPGLLMEGPILLI